MKTSKNKETIVLEAEQIANETGLSPRELLEQRDELLKVVIELQNQFNKDGNMTGHLWELCENAINKSINNPLVNTSPSAEGEMK